MDLLIEFQSTIDPYMAVLMVTYVGLLYQDLILRKEVLPHRRLHSLHDPANLKAASDSLE